MTSTKVILLVVLLSLFALTAFAAKGNIDWCGPDQCARSEGSVSAAATEEQETLSITIDNELEQVLAVYEDEEAETMDNGNGNGNGNGNNGSGKDVTTPTGKKYECVSDCRALFSSSSCERCTYPFAYYNKQVSKYNRCFNNLADMKVLSKTEQEQTKQMCITDGRCTCQPWERLEAYMANSCTFECAWLAKEGIEVSRDSTIYIPKTKEACPTKSNFVKFYGGNIFKVPTIEMCDNGMYTKQWLMNHFDLTRVFNWHAALTADVIDAAKKPNKVALKPIGGFSSAGVSEKLHFDTEGKLLAQNGWKATLYIHKSTRELTFAKTYTYAKVANKKQKEYLTEALNTANNEGFNSANADAKDFTSSIKINKDSVSVTFTLKVAAKQTTPFKKACNAIHKEFATALKTNTVPQNPIIAADIYAFIKAQIPAKISKIPAIGEYLKTKNLQLVDHVGQHKYSHKFTSQRIYLNVDINKNGVARPSFEFAAYSQDVLDEIAAVILAKINPAWVVSTTQD